MEIRKDTKRSIAIAGLALIMTAAGLRTVSRVDMDSLAASAQPTLAPEKALVTLDPGHGGADGGCISVDGTAEKGINLAIALDERDMLVLMGYRVEMTREDDRSVHDEGVEGLRAQKLSDMDNRLSLIRSNTSGIAISIHQNQFTDSRYSGAQMFYSRRNAGGEALARSLQGQLRSLLQPDNDREIKPVDDELYLLDNTDIPAVMAECGFLSNPEEAALLEDSAYQQQVAFAIMTGAVEFLESGVPAPADESSSPDRD